MSSRLRTRKKLKHRYGPITPRPSRLLNRHQANIMPFLKLPLELRILTYRFLLVQDRPLQQVIGRLLKGLIDPRARAEISIFLVCHQLYLEASEVFYSHNRFFFPAQLMRAPYSMSMPDFAFSNLRYVGFHTRLNQPRLDDALVFLTRLQKWVPKLQVLAIIATQSPTARLGTNGGPKSKFKLFVRAAAIKIAAMGNLKELRLSKPLVKCPEFLTALLESRPDLTVMGRGYRSQYYSKFVLLSNPATALIS
jgi:hypothetical protein